MKLVSQDDNCPLNGSTGEVRLAISFGDGQTGTSIVLRDGSILAAGARLDNVLVGDAATLKGKKVVIRSMVSQGNPSSEHFSVVHDVSATNTHERFVARDVFDQGVSASITETITFI